MDEVQRTILWVVMIAVFLVLLVGLVPVSIGHWKTYLKQRLADRKKRARRVYEEATKALDLRRDAAVQAAKAAWDEYGQTVEVQETESVFRGVLYDKVIRQDLWDTESYTPERLTFTYYMVSSAIYEKLYWLERFVEDNSRYFDERVVKEVKDMTFKNETVCMESRDELVELGFDLHTIDVYVVQIPTSA